MSDLDTEAIKARLAAFERANEEYVSVIANRPAMEPEYNYHLRVARREVEAHAPTDIAALLAEVERLQRERAEWCDRADALMTEQMTQMRDLLAENAALRERLTLTEDKVNLVHDWLYPWPEENGLRYATLGHSKVRAALLAAGMEDKP